MTVIPSWEATIEIEGQEAKRVRAAVFNIIYPIGHIEISTVDPASYLHGIWCRADRRSIYWKRIG